MTPAAWAFLATAWLLIGGTAAWCLYQILYAADRRKRKQ